MRRRAFLAGSGAALGLTWACGSSSKRGATLAARPARAPVVDLHCHNFNGEDIPLAAFLSGKFHNVPSWFMAANGAVFAGLAHIAAPSARCERDVLAGRGACHWRQAADLPLEIARWLLGTSVGSLLARLGFETPGPRQLNLARRFLADVDADALVGADRAIAHARGLPAAQGGELSPAERLLQFLELVGLGLVREGRTAALGIGRLLGGSKALDRDELRFLERSARRTYLDEFQDLYGAQLDRHIERDAPLAGDEKLHEKIAGEIARRGTVLLDAATLQPLARSGVQLLALLWSYVRGYGSFAASFFRYRHDLSRDIATTYARVDLFTPLLVDFSYWTGSAEQPRSPLSDQIAVQRQLALASLESAESTGRARAGGTVHIPAVFLPFIAFNPLREILRPSSGEYQPSRPLASLVGALDLVRAAVLENGFVGVKLYPPVGFAPLGNARHRRWEDGKLGRLDGSLSGEELERWRTTKGDLGTHLDEALRALYRFCQEHDVPIVAHSNDSNSFQPGYGWCSGPAHWLAALREFDRLRVCLGHFGHFTGVAASGDPAASHAVVGCFDQMSTYAWSYQACELFEYRNVYMDLSNSEAGSDEEARRRLVTLIRKLDARSGGELRERLIYGSDWFMNLLNGPHEEFFDHLEIAFETVWSDRATIANVMGPMRCAFSGSSPDRTGRRRPTSSAFAATTAPDCPHGCEAAERQAWQENGLGAEPVSMRSWSSSRKRAGRARSRGWSARRRSSRAEQ